MVTRFQDLEIVAVVLILAMVLVFFNYTRTMTDLKPLENPSHAVATATH